MMTVVILIEKLMDPFYASFLALFVYIIQYILIYIRIATLRTMASDTGQISLAGVQRFIYCGRLLTDNDNEK